LKGLGEWMDGWKKNGWTRGKRRQPVQNVELWKALDELRQVHELEMIWVRGHAGHPENERCDQLAVLAIEKYR